MIQFNVFPGGVKRVVTFSYDDGCPEDERIAELLRKYGVKGTFHLNSGRFGHLSELTDSRIRELRSRYEGHEISCHTVNHGRLEKMPDPSIVREVMEDRINLEKIALYPVCGMSYPFGTYNGRVKSVLSRCGIVYSRTVKATDNFSVPDDFLEWHPTCHQADAPDACKRFINHLNDEYGGPLLYIWGHGYELADEDDWASLEECVASVAHNEKIWYATNIEICRYVKAQRRLQISADERIIKNPTDTDVWVEADFKKVLIPSGETVKLQ